MVLLSIATDLRAAAPLHLPHLRPEKSEEEHTAVVRFLAQAYRDEAKTWIAHHPPFDPEAAWYAFEVLIEALYYYHGSANANQVEGGALAANPLQTYTGEQTASAVLSADLNLRFLAALRSRIRQVDADALEGVHLDEILANWSYSALLDNDPADVQLGDWFENACARQCFVDRLIERRRVETAKHPLLRPHIDAALGAHVSHFWPNFT